VRLMLKKQSLFISGRALVAAALVFLTLPIQARLAVSADLPSVAEMEKADIEVDAHGHSKVIIDRILRINNDEGRERESLQFIDFNDRASTLKILLAETINGKKRSAVDKKNIEIKPVGDFSRFFDTQKKAKITFPNVQVGSKIHLKYEMDVHEVPNEGFWSFLGDFNGWYMEKYEAHVRSAIPLYSWKNDPDNIFEMKPSKKGKFYFFDVVSKAPIAKMTTQEENPFIRSDRSNTFVISTMSAWSDYARATIVSQEKLYQVKKLPPSLESIRLAADGEKTVPAKLDRVAALISQEFRYFGDWRRRNGGFIPRSLKEIQDTRYGDCKDLSLAASAIYRALGFKADIAWTLRGESHLRPMRGWYTIPVDWFNHAVTRVEADGKVYWIDATNPVSYATSVPADISGKAAFVLNATKPYLEFIPELSAETSTTDKNLVYEYQPDASLKVTGELKLLGRAAINLTTSSFYKPVESMNYDLIHSLSYGYKLRDYLVKDFPRGSRIVSDATVPFEFTLEDVGVRTTSGYGFLLSREAAVDRMLEETRDRASDINMDSPGTWTTREEIVGVRRIGGRNLDCDLKSEWMNARREVRDTSGGVVATDRLEVLKNIVPNEAVKTPEFQKFQTQLRECFFRAAIIIEPTATKKPNLADRARLN
jgi:hypothetical protein